MRHLPLLWLSSLACSGEPTGAETDTETRTEVDLVDNDAWEEPADDPFADHKPEDVSCIEGGIVVEDAYLEVDTAFCNWAVVRQPSPHEVHTGDVLHLLTWYNSLWSDPPSTAHIAVWLGDQVLLDATVDVPGDAAVFDIEVAAEADFPAGTDIYWHVHNHGVNNYRFGYLKARPPTP